MGRRQCLGRVAIAVALGTAGCGPVGGSGARARSAALLAVEFLDPNDVNVEPVDAAPRAAPLNQEIRFTFGAAPDPARVNSTVLPIIDGDGMPVPGSYRVDGPLVTFTPALPLRTPSTQPDGSVDHGGAGLELGRDYTVRVGRGTFAFIASVAAELHARHGDPLDPAGVLILFRTRVDLDADALRGLEVRRPALVATDPLDGATGLAPGLFSDPDQLFAGGRPFRLVFDAPLRPDSLAIALIDLDDRPAAAPAGLPLGVDVSVVRNDPDGAEVEVAPSGILPLGHLLALELEQEPAGIAEFGVPPVAPRIATTFTTAADPGGVIRDAIVETFDANRREERGREPFLAASPLGAFVPADWNAAGNSVLQAAHAFAGTGSLGRFAPVAPPEGSTTTILIDTAEQPFPLLDGSTPDAKQGTVVRGGRFEFTEIDIPAGVIVRPSGANPLVLCATGSVRIGGTLALAGADGVPAYGDDRSYTSVPGGHAVAGGGRGGDSNPIVTFPPDSLSFLALVSSVAAETGFGLDPADGLMKRRGGGGAVNGILEREKSGKYQTDNELGNCDEFRIGNGACKIGGGGGGAMLRPGRFAADSAGNRLDGVANVVPDGQGGFLFDPAVTTLACGDPGLHPFADDGSTTNDFFGPLGQLTRLVGGQGGGGGATLTESYYCGNWCDLDADPANNGVCDNSDNLPWRGYAPSVGDARGGGGGGGGGALQIQAIGTIAVLATGVIDAHGGAGAGGEGLGCSYWGGGGGGGAGGAIVLQSGAGIVIEDGAVLDVRHGRGNDAAQDNDYADCSSTGDNPGDGGHGGDGLIQLQVPPGATAVVVEPGTNDSNGSLRPPASWVDPANVLAPAEFTPISMALSTWHDFGRVIARTPVGTNPLLRFAGTDESGLVLTDGDGLLPDPAAADIEVGYLGQVDPETGAYLEGEEPRGDWIPPNATVRVEFQAADAIAPGSKEVDPATLTAWSGDVAIGNGRQFLRWRITFDVTADGSALTPWSRRPIVERIEVGAEF